MKWVIFAVACFVGELRAEVEFSPHEQALTEKIATANAKDLDAKSFVEIRSALWELSVGNPMATLIFTKDLLTSTMFKSRPEFHPLFSRNPEYNTVVIVGIMAVKNGYILSDDWILEYEARSAGLSNLLKEDEVVKLAELTKAVIAQNDKNKQAPSRVER